MLYKIKNNSGWAVIYLWLSFLLKGFVIYTVLLPQSPLKELAFSKHVLPKRLATSSLFLTSCQPHRVTPGWSNSCYFKSLLIWQLFLKLNSSKSIHTQITHTHTHTHTHTYTHTHTHTQTHAPNTTALVKKHKYKATTSWYCWPFCLIKQKYKKGMAKNNNKKTTNYINAWWHIAPSCTYYQPSPNCWTRAIWKKPILKILQNFQGSEE